MSSKLLYTKALFYALVMPLKKVYKYINKYINKKYFLKKKVLK